MSVECGLTWWFPFMSVSIGMRFQCPSELPTLGTVNTFLIIKMHRLKWTSAKWLCFDMQLWRCSFPTCEVNTLICWSAPVIKIIPFVVLTPKIMFLYERPVNNLSNVFCWWFYDAETSLQPPDPKKVVMPVNWILKFVRPSVCFEHVSR